MKSSTHLVAAGYIAFASYAYLNTSPKETMIILAASAAGSILPDIDKKGSKVSNDNLITGLGSGIIRLFTSHRGFTHTVIGAGLISVLVTIVAGCLPIVVGNRFYYVLGWSLFTGMISHIILDSFNPKGIMWFWPISRKRLSLLDIKTGSFTESIFRLVLIGLLVFSLVSYFIFNR